VSIAALHVPRYGAPTAVRSSSNRELTRCFAQLETRLDKKITEHDRAIGGLLDGPHVSSHSTKRSSMDTPGCDVAVPAQKIRAPSIRCQTTFGQRGASHDSNTRCRSNHHVVCLSYLFDHTAWMIETAHDNYSGPREAGMS
jgi:hypothetical protein